MSPASDVSRQGQPAASFPGGATGGKCRGRRQAFAPVSSDVANGGKQANNRVVNRPRVSVHYDNNAEHNHIIEEVINDDNKDPNFPALTGRLLKPANRQ